MSRQTFLSQLSKFIDKIIDRICNYVATKTFLIFCILLTFLGSIPSLMVYVQFISSAFLQLVLLPVLAMGQKKQSDHNDKLMARLIYLENQQSKANQEIKDAIDSIKEYLIK